MLSFSLLPRDFPSVQLALKIMTLSLLNAVRELGNQLLGHCLPFFSPLKEMKQNKTEKPECAVESNDVGNWSMASTVLVLCRDIRIFLWIVIQKIS